ncbi:MAG: ASKHA domain-containing protein, partial [Chloroflexi bacterium]|nr:ASKHA domain-containing protein [Chloroflexota bacterium]
CVAVDVGTTKLACYLVDLETGQTRATMGVMNPQIAYGEDVMSRLEAAMVDAANADRLQRDLVECINSAVAQLCATAGAAPERLVDLCLVGNTAMHHLLAKLPVRPLALLPFVPALRSPLQVDADRLGLHAASVARVYLPPPIAGFVGSDHLAFLLAAGFHQDRRTRLGIDIGTNTEIALHAGGRILSCSTASGPAFEGAHIRHGMRAAPGAIDRVRLGEDGLAHCDVLGSVPAVGICGSGILDAVAEMRRVHIVNRRGRMDPAGPGVQTEEDGTLILPLARGNNGSRDVGITQRDVDQVLLAKGAIRAGIAILLDQLGVTPAEIEEIVIAGAFGSYLDPVNALRIGLLPDVPLERIHPVGNAAGAGARMLLASTECRRQAQALADRIEYVELTVVPGFNKCFAESMRLPGV